MTGGLIPGPPPLFFFYYGANGNMSTEHLRRSPESKVMRFFGLGNLEHIPPHPKNAFWGVRWVRGAPGGRFFTKFLRFFKKNLNWFMKEVEFDHSVF